MSMKIILRPHSKQGQSLERNVYAYMNTVCGL